MANPKQNQRIAVDLHMHSIYSDGINTPQQLVKDNALLGLDAIAITDHDTTAGYKEAKQEAEHWGIKVIPGVEITTTAYHILGLNVNIENKQLQDLLAYARSIQLEMAKARVEILTSHGVPITLEKVMASSPDSPESRLGKTNIVYTLIKDRECRDYIRKTLPRNYTISDVFRYFVGKHGLAGKLPGKFKGVRSKEAIGAIHEASGLAVIAHPFKEVVDLEKEMAALREKGIDGLEIQPNFTGANAPFIAYAAKHNMLTTYGSDFHGVCFPERPLLGKKENLMEPFWNEPSRE